MKALVVNALGRGFDLEDVDIAAPIGREVSSTCKRPGCVTPTCFSPLTISSQRRWYLVTRLRGSCLQWVRKSCNSVWEITSWVL